MANMLENYGLEFFYENEESLMGFLGYLVQEGKAITGYYGMPYLFKPTGNVEFWIKTNKTADEKLEVVDFDTHCGGNCVWEMVHSGIDITPKDAPKLNKTVIFNRLDSGGLLPVDIIAADVLPGLRGGDKVKMQMIALPLEINYYTDEDAFAEAQPADDNGKKWLIKVGTMAALSFLYNHSPNRYDKEKDYPSDKYLQFAATVKKLFHGTFEINGEKHNTFIRCIVDTDYGELEFDHTLEQVPEELRDNIKVGAVISGTCILSGDVAIYEYDNGIVKDFDHNLKLLQYTFEGGDPERLSPVLAADVVYETDTSGKSYIGARAIIDKISYVQKNKENEYNAHLATITSIDGDDIEYPINTRCIVLASGAEDNYESIAFITVDNDGMISKIKISTDDRYHFRIDKIEENNENADESDN